jgi:hypothetical protein
VGDDIFSVLFESIRRYLKIPESIDDQRVGGDFVADLRPEKPDKQATQKGPRWKR